MKHEIHEVERRERERVAWPLPLSCTTPHVHVLYHGLFVNLSIRQFVIWSLPLLRFVFFLSEREVLSNIVPLCIKLYKPLPHTHTPSPLDSSRSSNSIDHAIF